jgi:hypothetical protein
MNNIFASALSLCRADCAQHTDLTPEKIPFGALNFDHQGPDQESHFLRLGERAFVRPSILESLALSALNDLRDALRILNAKCRTV